VLAPFSPDYEQADRERKEAEDKLILASNARKTQQAECKEVRAVVVSFGCDCSGDSGGFCSQLQREKEEAELYEQRMTELVRSLCP
jgi:hypothetical protein